MHKRPDVAHVRVRTGNGILTDAHFGLYLEP